MRLEAHQLHEPEKLEMSEPIIKKKRKPCQEAGIFPIRTQHNNKGKYFFQFLFCEMSCLNLLAIFVQFSLFQHH